MGLQIIKIIICAFCLGLYSYNALSAGAHHHHHAQIELAGTVNPPEIKIKLHKDAKSGWNLEVMTEHFVFSPAQTNQAHVAGKGHAHVYVDGEKLGRLYGNWMHITGLKPGIRTIKVTLNSNDHRDFAIEGEVIGDESVIEAL